jgi:chemotaxis protein MotB
MARMRQWIGIAAVGLSAVSLTGCVPQEKYTALKIDDDQLREQLGQSQTETRQAEAEAAAYKSQLASLANSGNNTTALETNLTTQNANLQAQLDEMNRKYADAMAKTASLGAMALPAPLSNALSDFAAQNPDLVEFDAARGIVKFKSDVTFRAGDTTITAKAQDVLQRFATILDSSGARRYELLVAGHTDSTPVVNPETIRKGNLDNWYLSAHRAITVSKALMADGVSPARLGAVGYADERPVASNATDSGKALNRRVEVLILPTAVSSHESFASSGGSRVSHHGHVMATPEPVPAGAMINKDSAASDMGGMNK